MDHTARTVAVLLFIGAVAAAALYCAQRRTVARGEVLAAQLLEANPVLRELRCQPEIPIGVDGARFPCTATFKSGDRTRYVFELDREGQIKVVEEGATDYAPRDYGPPPPPPPGIKKTTDPWGD